MTTVFSCSFGEVSWEACSLAMSWTVLRAGAGVLGASGEHFLGLFCGGLPPLFSFKWGFTFPFWVNFSVFLGDFLTGDLALEELFLVSFGCLAVVVPLELSLLDPMEKLWELLEDFLVLLSV